MKLTHIGMYPLMAALVLGAWAVTPNLVQPAAAQQAEDDEERYRARFSRIDTNLDSIMVSYEYTVYRVATFNNMDSNGDGQLALGEFRDRGRNAFCTPRRASDANI